MTEHSLLTVLNRHAALDNATYYNAPAPAEERIAIVVNGSARSVTHRTIHELGRLIADESLFVSRSLEHSRFIARQIVSGGYTIVLCGGGDGTFTRVVSDVMALNPSRPPAFGALPLGTGNAIATALGVARGSIRDLASELAHVTNRSERVLLPLVRVEGQLTPFVGCGMDAQILQDYRSMREKLPTDVAKNLLSGALGYGCSIATRSMWRYLWNSMPEVVIRNEGLPAYRIDLAGRMTGRPIPRGEILYRGPASIAAAATIPCCGFGIKLYPQAGKRSDRFHLRVGQPRAHQVFTKIPQIVSGQFESQQLFDFYCTSVSMQVPRGAVFQAGGDLLGSRTHVRLDLDHVEAVTGSLGAPMFRPVPNYNEPYSLPANAALSYS